MDLLYGEKQQKKCWANFKYLCNNLQEETW